MSLDSESLKAMLHGVAAGAKSGALRTFVAVSRANPEELFAWEVDPTLQAKALKEAALLPWKESMQAVMDFFSSFGISLSATPDFSEPAGAESAAPQEILATPTES